MCHVCWISAFRQNIHKDSSLFCHTRLKQSKCTQLMGHVCWFCIWFLNKYIKKHHLYIYLYIYIYIFCRMRLNESNCTNMCQVCFEFQYIFSKCSKGHFYDAADTKTNPDVHSQCVIGVNFLYSVKTATKTIHYSKTQSSLFISRRRRLTICNCIQQLCHRCCLLISFFEYVYIYIFFYIYIYI